MKIPLRQTSWFGLNLEKLAQDLVHDVEKVAGSNVYSEVYKELLSSGCVGITPRWLKLKLTLSDWLSAFLKTQGLHKSSILSVGCGLGVVECSLIEQSINVDLQECQDISIQYLAKNHPDVYKKTRFILSQDLSNLTEASYDVVMAITSSYCLKDLEINEFFKAIHRILKPEGVFIFYETTLSLKEIFYHLKNKLGDFVKKRKPQGILWGWKRSENVFIELAKNNDFFIKDKYHFNFDNEQERSRTWFGLFCNPKVAWQMVVMKKNN